MAKKKKTELPFQQHIADYLVREHKDRVLEQTDITDTTMHWIAPSEKDPAAFTLEKAYLLITPSPLLKKFGDATIPMAEQIHTLQRQIQNLRRTRGLLLPSLLSGQVNLGDPGP
jgi:hypothetical protein